MEGDSPIPLVDLAGQHRLIEAELVAAFRSVVAAGDYILAPPLDRFENAFAEMHGVTDAIGVNSGTDALYAAVKALGIGPGDEVITTSSTWISTAFAADYAGARAVFCDIHPDHLQLDPASLAARITDRTKAVIVVHLYGHPAPMREIEEICNPRGIAIIEDVAQAVLARSDGRLAGTIGAIGCFSFYPSKNLGGLGDGGAILTNRPDLAQRIRSFTRYGQVEPHRHEEVGINSRLDSLQAALLSVMLRHLPEWTEARRRLARRYREMIGNLSLKMLPERAGCEPVHHLFPIQVDHRDRILAALREDGIKAQVHYPSPIHLQPVYRRQGWRQGDLPVTEAVMPRLLSLPIFPGMTDTQLERVVGSLRSALAA